MGQRNGRSAARSRHEDRFPRDVAKWILKNGILLDALVALRRMGAEGADAVEAVLSIRRVAELRLSWELWAALAEGDGRNPYLELTWGLSAGVLDGVVAALWGSAWDAPDDRRLRSV